MSARRGDKERGRERSAGVITDVTAYVDSTTIDKMQAVSGFMVVLVLQEFLVTSSGIKWL